jgi:hypothetical protein
VKKEVEENRVKKYETIGNEEKKRRGASIGRSIMMTA